ncbi:galactan 5-O-arabinofuranosyltransferase [Corynebacterium fournieri]|uniref:galactan 5-O-arabinofuranosyltransferase n=1 Tax=Corynebacterium fournieri TaxID=1852390 RepID=UPI000A2F4D77|nr:galactan 5-O-arabinofuranosyltransferase [Corynebacterium fournieri]WJY96530.1 Arabinofuranosyltransferase AftA [Corynebacterium fournieri]
MTTAYHPDEQSVGQTAARTVAAGLAGGVIALAAWFVLHKISLPAFNTSMVTRSLATAASFVCIGVGVVLAVLWTKGKKPWISSAVMSLVPAGLVVSSIGIPLGATRLYLDGIQVDQGFRTQFLSRMTENLGHADMAYKGLPTFYPMGWFWLGGRTANVLDMPGWEVYQPYAIATLAAAAAMLTPVWRRLTGSLPTALAIATVTTAVVLTEVPEEPYAAVVAMFLPAAAVMAYRAVSGSWAATIALAVYLGISASFYTLFTAIAALTVVVIAIVLAFNKHSFTPVVHLVVVGAISLAIAAVSWGPYVWWVLTGDEQMESTANHFLPIEGTYFPLPFLSFSLVGLLSMIGLIYLVSRIKDPEVGALGASIGVCYLWALASMAITLLGTSLLGFRLEVLIVELFATLGVIAIAEFGLNKYTPAVAAILAVGALQMVQHIPVENEDYIDQAYADTDGYGERADRFPADAGRYYNEIAAYIEEHGHKENDAVIYTDEINFMAFHPFFGFNAYTSHYANPLGEFEHRNDELKQWAEISYDDPEKFTEAVDNSQWEPPTAFIFRDNGKDGYKTHIAHDIYPSQPNVRYEGLFYNPEAFAKDWDVKQIGPFAVAVRK